MYNYKLYILYYVGYSLHLSYEGSLFISHTVIGYSDSRFLFFQQ